MDLNAFLAKYRLRFHTLAYIYLWCTCFFFKANIELLIFIRRGSAQNPFPHFTQLAPN